MTAPILPPALMTTSLTQWPVRRGKVRDVYDMGDRLLLIATDRISAFDWVLSPGIPDKGRILTQISAMWFERLKIKHHLLSMDVSQIGLPSAQDVRELSGRSMIVQKTQVVPIECVARGYLAGSGWKEYQQSGTVCGIPLPPGLQESAQLPEPIFTPATKADEGHDENISFETMCQLIDPALAQQLKELTLSIYQKAATWAHQQGIIIADTKFEFGLLNGEIILIDEVLTPDSSRFWPLDQYRPGCSPPSFDKQFVRNWLEKQPWDKQSPPPILPDNIVSNTRALYLDAYRRLVGSEFV
jgi:phosphoribosylaminoimidazole-succinocarboxamide synthase